MKKLSYLFGLILIGGLIFSSCKKDETEPLPPTLNFLGGTEPTTGMDRISTDATLDPGEKFVFGFAAKSNSDKNLSHVRVTRNYENVDESVLLDTALSTSSYQREFINVVAYTGTPGTEVFEVFVTDKNDKSTSISFTITTNEPDPGINEYTEISLGSYQSNTNSSFASIDGNTYSIAQAYADTMIQKKIDWVYFNGQTRGHTLMSPSNSVAESVYSGSTGLANWTIRRTTKFSKTTLTPTDYNGITNKNQLVIIINAQQLPFSTNYYSENVPAGSGFVVNDIIAFETQGGKYGLIKITQITPGADNGHSTIKYDLKVAKTAK